MPQTQVGTRLTFENDHVEVWAFTLGPGEETDAHTHEGGTVELKAPR